MIMSVPAASLHADSPYRNNRAPLVSKPYMELPLGAVRPEGWLKEQMQYMADGMTGHLDEIVPNIMGERNGWLGGDGDKWERGPYWIDGLLPLAYQLDDAKLKAKAQRWVEWTLASQQENGFFGPDGDLPNVDGLQRDRTHDWWPRMVVLKFLQQYYEATSDERVITFMTKYFHYQLERLPHEPLDNWSYWGRERGADNLIVCYWLYNITGDESLLKLGEILSAQTAPWTERLSGHQTLFTHGSLHCVNLAQGFKTPVIQYQASGDPALLEVVATGYKDLMLHLGWPNGMYGADELLHSGDPTQGSEFCSTVELMYSLERMVEITGRTDWADWLERIAYNALPTQATDNYDGRQYYQQLNQIEVSCKPRNFNTPYNGTEATFGPLTGFPCCTANMHQGWPKFVRDLWMASEDGGLATMYYGPCSVDAYAGGAKVTLKEDGSYPFGETVRVKITAMDKRKAVFPMYFRIPGWCNEAVVKVNGSVAGSYSGGETARIERTWRKGDLVELVCPMTVKVSRWYENSAAVERGPLVFALKMEEKWEKVENKGNPRHGAWFWEVKSESPWNYCLMREDVKAAAFDVVTLDWDGSYPWNLENVPVEIHARGRRMPQWQPYGGNTGPIPYSDQYQAELGPVEDIVLVPYGCTSLRITEFPVTY